VAKQPAIAGLLSEHVLSEDTIVFSNAITSSDELASAWRLPLRNTWLSKYLVHQDK
jgi:hypothetical protein